MAYWSIQKRNRLIRGWSLNPVSPSKPLGVSLLEVTGDVGTLGGEDSEVI